jgi:hypothetical protein
MILIGILSGLGASAFIYLLYEIFRCKHQWEFVDKTEFPAPIETAKKNGVDVRWDLTSWQLHQMSKKTVVIVIRCPKCGTPKVLKEKH